MRLYDDDARHVLDWLPEASMGRVFVLFPDPWPKKRHRKRRFLSADGLSSLARVLRPGGELRFATDIADYAAMVTGLDRRARRLCRACRTARRAPRRLATHALCRKGDRARDGNANFSVLSGSERSDAGGGTVGLRMSNTGLCGLRARPPA